jgi:hypothetical protein
VHDYVPERDANLADWAASFSATLVAEPWAYGISPAEAADLAGRVDAYVVALERATAEGARTRATIAAKDGARAAMLTPLRHVAQRIRLDLGVSNERKAGLGLAIADPTLTPRVAGPVTSPVLKIVGATPGEHTLRFADSAAPARRARPEGTIGLLLFVAIGADAAGDPEEARFAMLVTRQPFAVPFEHTLRGKTATYFARWQSRRGKMGPWSAPVSFTIAA